MRRPALPALVAVIRWLWFGVAAFAVVSYGAEGRAACTVDSQLVSHAYGGHIFNCPDANPVTGYVYLLSSPGTVNSGLQSDLFICREAFAVNGLGLACPAEAGVIGDGNVTVLYDFGIGNPGAVGCPNPAQTGNGATPVAVQVVCNNGASAVLSVGYSGDLEQFVMESAHPYDEPSGFLPINAGGRNGPWIINKLTTRQRVVSEFRRKVARHQPVSV